ncbi:MAG: radical SAM protein [Elusimicrobiota bacterium]|jgi:organic radical activating enzyme|nr:radical SAM protein [Elusimicrobiota bacterium]
MDRIKRFIDCFVPVSTCNLRCHYCYVTQSGEADNKLPEFHYSAKHIAQALSKQRLGGICCMNFCGAGETLLPPEMPDIIKELLLEGHYIMTVTNGTAKSRFDEITTFPKDILERLFFKFSFQYLELKRLNIFEEFFGNIEKVKKAGCSFSVELTPCDEEIPYIEDIKKLCLENTGALCHITVARDNTKYELPILTNLPKEEYKKVWGQFNSEMFDYKISVFGLKQTDFCYAGDWTCVLNIADGVLMQCYKGKKLQNIYSNLDSPINFEPIGKHCLESHCYNAHAFLTFGAIPTADKNTPSYADMRNRSCRDGGQWLTPKMKKFMSGKLQQSNRQLKKFDIYKNRLLSHICAGQKKKEYRDRYKKLKELFAL